MGYACQSDSETTDKRNLSIDSSNPLFFHLENKSFVFSWGKISTTPHLLKSLLLFTFLLLIEGSTGRRPEISTFSIHFASVFISLSTSKSLNALDVIAVHSCKLLPQMAKNRK